MGRLFLLFLEGSFYSCKYCQAHLAVTDDIISKLTLGLLFCCCVLTSGYRVKLTKLVAPVLLGESKSFHSRHGKAYLFENVVNVFEGEREERMMMTGMHTVVDIYCVGCCSLLGWKYESAEDKSQKYKEGKFILERFQILGPDGSGYSGSHEAQLEGGSDGDEA
nr:protein yippee-like [Ipomoea batatas]